MLHLPILRGGRPYRSVERAVLRHAATGEPVAEVSQANPGLVGRDLDGAADRRRALGAVPAAELTAIAGRAARLFATADLPVGDGVQSPADYLRLLAATTGMPESLGRLNLAKIETVLGKMETVVAGLTRGLDPVLLDRGWGAVGRNGGRQPVAYRRETDVLGVVLPSNSPGVHGVWIPALALKVPVALKPGGREPWTPYRVAQALFAAGCPPEAVSFYPGDHAVATEILLRSGRSLLFGDRSTVGGWAGDPRVQLHGPGWSKVVVGPDVAGGDWRRHLDLIVTSVAANGGRSCVNASGVWVATAGRRGAGRRGSERRTGRRDRGGAGRAAGGDPRPAARRSGGPARRLPRPGDGAGDLGLARRPAGDPRRRGRHGALPRAATGWWSGTASPSSCRPSCAAVPTTRSPRPSCSSRSSRWSRSRPTSCRRGSAPAWW